MAQPAPPDPALVDHGRRIFRFDTYGNESFWTDTLRLHEVIRASVSPATALEVGLKVDADALPDRVKDDLRAGRVDLNDPATTVTELELGAVVGLAGTVEAGNLTRDRYRVRVVSLDRGRLVRTRNRSTPGRLAESRSRSRCDSWGSGRYDPRFNQDGRNYPVVIPPAYGLQGVALAMYTGDGDISYWNRYVAGTQMRGHGSFVDKGSA